MIGEYLTGMITSVDETLYRGVFRLPPAHSMTIESGRLRRRRYWDIDPAKEIRCRSDGEFAEHFLELFQEAVRCRLRSHRPVGAYLSGGLDSSAVVCAAESLRRRGLADDLEFETFSQVYPGLDCDETTFIDQVVRMWDTRANSVSLDAGEDANWYAEQVLRYLDFPDYPGGNSGNCILSLAREKGFRVLLTGFGGDEWLSGSSWHYADLLRGFRVFELLRRVRSDRRTSALAINPLLAVLQSAAWPLVPREMRRALRMVLGRNRVPAWLNRSFARRIGVVERTRHEALRKPLRSFAQAALYRTLNDGGTSHALEMEERSASLLGLEQRHPFHDRRIVEFAHALPEEQRCASGEPKSILRRAMSSLVPEGVRRRQSKAEFSHSFVDAFRALGGARLYESLAIAAEGWVDGPRVRRMYAEMERLHARGDAAFMRYVWPLWMIFGIELWFTMVFLNRNPLEGKRP
jgi:asparagine synthase (glutamine-hydrolysing)